MNKKGQLGLLLATIPFWGFLVIIVIGILLLFGTTYFLYINLAKIVGFLVLFLSSRGWQKGEKLEGINLIMFILGLILIFNPFQIVDKILPMAVAPLN